MFDSILDLCRSSITSAVGWFSHFSDKIGFVSALLGLFLLYNVIRFLIIPLIGSGMFGFSDTVREQKAKNATRKEHRQDKGGKKK